MAASSSSSSSSSSSLTTVIIAALIILALTCPAISTRPENSYKDGDDINDSELHALCEQTRKPKLCREIMKGDVDGRFVYGGDRLGLAEATVDLARARAEEIDGKLNCYYGESKNDELKDKYSSCSKSYKGVMASLDAARRNLELAKHAIDWSSYRRNHAYVDGAVDELENCRRRFDGSAFDPAHIGDRNNEFGVYLDMVKLSNDRWEAECSEMFRRNNIDWKN